MKARVRDSSFETKELHICGSEIRTELHPLVHIRDGVVLHKFRPEPWKRFMKNVTIVDMHERFQLCSDLTSTDIYDFFNFTEVDPKSSFHPSRVCYER